eukprot:205546-Ditylum_brightwellii.AAC.1
MGNDEYPCSFSAAHKLLVGWEGGSYVVQGPSNDCIAYTTVGEGGKEEASEEEGNVFVQGGGKILRGKKGNVIKCYLCRGNHYSCNCNKKEESGDKKKKKTGIMNVTTIGNIPGYDIGNANEEVGDW